MCEMRIFHTFLDKDIAKIHSLRENMSFLHDIESYNRACGRFMSRPERAIWMQHDDRLVTLYTIQDPIHSSLKDFLAPSPHDADQASHKQLNCTEFEDNQVIDEQIRDGFDCHPEQFTLKHLSSTVNFLDSYDRHLNSTHKESEHVLTG